MLNLEIEKKCFQIVKWHILKYSMDDQMRAIHKLNKEKAEILGKAEKQFKHLAWLLRDFESIAQSNERFGQG